MVVVSGTWVKNVATFPTPTLNDMVINNSDNKMTARAVLICRPNSHPFQERTLTLDQPVKVGRCVARDKPTPTNAIFDCKVLSRHHALLWYEDGKFFLQDTKSSNGTFVNNNRLSAELDHHEISSGDIVQFGVDVVENNRQVTHGCIVATFKLYLPDGKEAKASPTIIENNSQVVPLDELYKLHSIIQEATQREQCLESKLMTLQTIVDEAKKSAEESWQAYVGEERLLSRVSALETQLQQAGKNWTEDKYREEIKKLMDDSAAHQVAAKQALEKLHTERLEALAAATEQERSRISAEQSLLLTKEQLIQTQEELEELSKRISEEQKLSKKEKDELEREIHRLQVLLANEHRKREYIPLFAELNSNDDEDEVSSMKAMMTENLESIIEKNKANGVESTDHDDNRLAVIINKEVKSEYSEKNDSVQQSGGDTLETILDNENKDNADKHVTFNLTEESIDVNQNGSSVESPTKTEENEKDDFDNDAIDTKTLKYKYQSAQNELKKRVEMFESIVESNKCRIIELERTLKSEKKENEMFETENKWLREELASYQQKLKESSNENKELLGRVTSLTNEIQSKENQNDSHEKDVVEQEDQTNQLIISTNNQAKAIVANCGVSYEQFVCLEEELVMLKQRYSQSNDEKLKLQKDLANLKDQYNKMCNSSYDKMYFYMAPLILMILYLVISAMIS